MDLFWRQPLGMDAIQLIGARLNDHVTEVIDWQHGGVLRQLAGTYASARARPDSQDFLVGMPSTRHQFGLDVYILRGDGSAFEVARSVEIIDQ